MVFACQCVSHRVDPQITLAYLSWKGSQSQCSRESEPGCPQFQPCRTTTNLLGGHKQATVGFSSLSAIWDNDKNLIFIQWFIVCKALHIQYLSILYNNYISIVIPTLQMVCVAGGEGALQTLKVAKTILDGACGRY